MEQVIMVMGIRNGGQVNFYEVDIDVSIIEKL